MKSFSSWLIERMEERTPDGGKRPRRTGERSEARKKFYAGYRSERFCKRFGLNPTGRTL